MLDVSRETTHPRSRLGVAVDGGVDGAVLSFAAWTLFYEVALWARWQVWTAAAVWAVLAVAAVLGGAVTALRREPRPSSAAMPDEPAKGAIGVVEVTVAVLAVIVLLGLRSRIGLPGVVLGSIAVIVVLLARSWRRGATRPAVISGRVSWWSDLVAVAVGLAVSGLASFLLKPDADDTFFVNRSLWVAEHGVPSLRDTLYGPEELPSAYAGGLPLSSVESLWGGLAHLVGISAGSLIYLVVLPVLAFAMTWATWRLCRAWASRAPLLVFLVAVSFLLMSAESTVGSYSLGRLWQGKALAFIMLTPLIWAYVTELLQQRTRRHLLLLAAAGVCFVGLASTATLQVPMIAAPAVVAAIVLRDRLLLAGAMLLAAAPVIAGAVVAASPVPVAGAAPEPLPIDVAFGYMTGIAPAMVGLSLVAVVVGPFLVRGRARALVAFASLAALLALVPGVFELANALTGAGPVLWRMLLGVPTWVLVGLLVTVRWPARTRAIRLAPVVVAVAVGTIVMTSGTPLWSDDVGARLTDRPTWKVDQRALADVRALDRAEVGPGPWLLPPVHMEVLPIHTTEHFPLVPRGFYLPGPEAKPGDQDARQLLYQTEFVAGNAPLPPSEAIVAALDHLDVALMCALEEDAALRAWLDGAGRTRKFAGLRCLRLDGAGAATAWDAGVRGTPQ